MRTRIAQQAITVEVCPTSNLLIGGFASYEELPYGELITAGIPVSLNTDNPGVFLTTLPAELDAMYSALARSQTNAARIRWLTDRVEDGLRSTFLEPQTPKDRAALRAIRNESATLSTELFRYRPPCYTGKQ